MAGRHFFSWVLYALVWAAVGCQFDRSGIAVIDGGVVDEIDAALVDAEPVWDAGPCPEPLFLSLRIGGVSEVADPAEPFVRVLPGDVIELSAAGSCAQRGGLQYQWQISPVDATRSTALPDLVSETLTLYPTQAREYVVTLTIDDGVDSRQRTVLGFAAQGWQQHNGLPGSQEIRDVAAGDSDLWIAHKDGAYRMPLGQAASEFFAVNGESEGEVLGANLGAVHFSPDANVVWFAEDAARDDLWRVDLNQKPARVAAVAYSTAAALGEPARVFDIGAAAPGVALATDRGLTVSTDTLAFAGAIKPADVSVHAVQAGSGRRFAGGKRLYDLDNGAIERDPFEDPANPDNKIRALAIDDANQELWVGSDNKGVSRVLFAGGFAVAGVYGTAFANLEVDKIRGLAVETAGPYAGDVWAATGAGVARYVRTRDTWLLMGNSHGLNGRTNVNAVVVDEAAGRRVIYAGTKSGLVSLQLP